MLAAAECGGAVGNVQATPHGVLHEPIHDLRMRRAILRNSTRSRSGVIGLSAALLDTANTF